MLYRCDLQLRRRVLRDLCGATLQGWCKPKHEAMLVPPHSSMATSAARRPALPGNQNQRGPMYAGHGRRRTECATESQQLHKRNWVAGQKANINGVLPHRTQSSACHPRSAAGCRARARRPGRSPTATWLPVSSMQPVHANGGTHFTACTHGAKLCKPSTCQQEEHCPSKRLPHSLEEVLHQAQAVQHTRPLLIMRRPCCD